nr:MAG TPA: hypothetical protein [Caudoviricetes sp.]
MYSAFYFSQIFGDKYYLVIFVSFNNTFCETL